MTRNAKQTRATDKVQRLFRLVFCLFGFVCFVFFKMKCLFKARGCVALCLTMWFLPPLEEAPTPEDAEAAIPDHPADSES